MGVFSSKKKEPCTPKHLRTSLSKFSEAILAGRLEHFSAIDGIQYVLSSRPSGILTFHEIQGKVAELFIQEGHLIRATGTGQTNIGEILLKQGSIEKDILKHALRIQKISEGKIPLGSVLVKLGAVEEKAIRDAVVIQIQEIVAQVIDWKKGLFFFCSKNHRSPDGIMVNLTELVLPGTVRSDWVLLEAVRARDEAKKK